MVTVQNLPTLTNGQYQCAFRMGNGTPRFTRAELLGNPTKDSTNRTLQCETPMKNRLPMVKVRSSVWKNLVLVFSFIE